MSSADPQGNLFADPLLRPTQRALARSARDGAAKRVLWVGRVMIALLTVALLGLLGRVVQLTTQPHPRVAALVETQESTRPVAGRRGALLDRRGRALASTRVAQRLFVDPHLIVERDTFAERVAYTLNYDPVEIDKTLTQRSGSRYIVLDRRLDEVREAKVAELNLPGLATEPVLVRDYPQGQLAGQLLGFVGADGDGLEGLEALFNKDLKPQAGKLRYLRDAQRRPLWVTAEGYQPHVDGQTVRLSLDVTIQAFAEQALRETVEKYQAEAGQIVVLQPHTGEILALANYPVFAPGDFRTSTPEERRNRAVTDVFEPGSIFKPFVWAAATQMGMAQPHEKIDTTTKGWWKPARGPVLRDASPHGLITWDQVLVYSSNIGMAKVAERMGNEKLHDVMAAFGFGKTTGSGLTGEMAGILRPVKSWSATDLTRMPMGHGVAVTALQVTRAFCVIANDGILVTPTIRALDPADIVAPLPEQRVLLPQVAAHTRQVLARAVSEGTGRKAKSKLYSLFGKSGTAQLPDVKNGGYVPNGYVSSFIAGAPADSPRLVVGCFIHKPDKKIGHYGGTVSGPAVKQVMEQSLLYLGVPVEPGVEGAEGRLVGG